MFVKTTKLTHKKPTVEFIYLTLHKKSAMFKKFLQKIKARNLTFQVKEMLEKKLNMELDLQGDLWDQIIQLKNLKYPNPEFVSVYRARKELGFTQNVLDGLVDEGFVRTNGETPPKYAFEDIKEMSKIRGLIEELEDNEVFKKTVIEGKTKYLIVDVFEHKKTLDKYKFNLLSKVVSSLFEGYTLTKIDKSD